MSTWALMSSGWLVPSGIRIRALHLTRGLREWTAAGVIFTVGFVCFPRMWRFKLLYYPHARPENLIAEGNYVALNRIVSPGESVFLWPFPLMAYKRISVVGMATKCCRFPCEQCFTLVKKTPIWLQTHLNDRYQLRAAQPCVQASRVDNNPKSLTLLLIKGEI